jgi:beta-glucosidase/6-phospho-beta-glucosidase/beta-galactosidase
MDDLEWTEGGGTRLGLLYVDVTTPRRTPRRSGTWYREAARRDAVG